MIYKISKIYEFEFEEKEYEAYLRVDLYCDPNYGADADGNRGMSMWFIDNIEIDTLINMESGDYVEPTDEIKEYIYDNFELDDMPDRQKMRNNYE